MTRQAIVLDTNIVLDVFVFKDAGAVTVLRGLESGELDWIATTPMRDELVRVLGYSKIVVRLSISGLSAEDGLARFDRYARIVNVAEKASLTCSDPDDQPFIDVAVAHQALLLSKDQAVISMKKRLLAQGVRAQTAL